jgi:hypothetical protein
VILKSITRVKYIYNEKERGNKNIQIRKIYATNNRGFPSAVSLSAIWATMYFTSLPCTVAHTALEMVSPEQHLLLN